MKKIKANLVLFLVVLCSHLTVHAYDSVKVLSRDALVRIIRNYHPVVRQADIQVDIAGANTLQARGGFDPALQATFSQKSFDGKLYYSYLNPQVTIPTWYGIDLKAGLEEITGTRVSPEATLGKTSYLGVKLPANNLLFDKRRATLRQAQGYQKLSLAERRLTINELLYDGLAAYWNWVEKYQIYQIVSEVIAINEQRLRFVVTEYEQGSRPAIDTVEALAQLQSFYIQKNTAWLAYQNAGLELSNFLWLDDNSPIVWDTLIIPDVQDIHMMAEPPPVAQILEESLNTHPKLAAIGIKGDILETERRLKAQYLLPKLNVNANLLSKGYDLPDEVSAPFLQNNYKLGVDFSLPLLFREARGGYQAARLKIQQNNLEQDNTLLQIQNKIKAYYNEVTILKQQLMLYEQTLSNNQKLLQGEKLRFEIGESNLFVLNSRENKVLETSQKLVELRTKWHKSFAGLLWAAGKLN